MKILCKIFGHKTDSKEKYFEVTPYIVDNRYIRIADIKIECKRCGDLFKVGMIRFPDGIHDEMMEKMRKKVILKIDSHFRSTVRETMKYNKKVMTSRTASVIRMDISFKKQKTNQYVVQYFDFTKDDNWRDEKITNLSFMDAMSKHNELVKKYLIK